MISDEAVLLRGVQKAIGECKALFAEVPVTELITPVKIAKTEKRKKGEDETSGENV